MDFSYLLAPQRDLMVGLASVDRRNSPPVSSLISFPVLSPRSFLSYSTNAGAAHATLHIRSDTNSSPVLIACWIGIGTETQVNFLLGSWIHSQLPSGGALNIASFSAYLTPTAVPSFLMELIQSSPTVL